MSTRIVFNFQDCFTFDEGFTSYEPSDLELLTRATNDFVRFARHVEAMTIEFPPLVAAEGQLAVTRFLAISPGLKLETRHLPADADAVGYIREALSPIVAADEAELTEGVGPPQGHYSLHIQDELGVPDPTPQLARLAKAVQELRDHLEPGGSGGGSGGGGSGQGKKKKRRRRSRGKKQGDPAKSSPYARSVELADED